MKKRKFIWLTLGMFGVALACVLIWWPERPVVYQGKDVWQWTWQLYSPSQPEREAATAALRHIGPAAVPSLVQKLRTDKSFVRKTREWLGAKLPGAMGRGMTKGLKPISFVSIRSAAATGLKALGTNASSAVPALLVAMRDPELQVMWDTAGALGAIGEHAVLGLIPLLDDQKPQVRHAAVYALGEIGPAALPAVPALMRRLNDANLAVRESTAYTLSRIGPLAGPAVLKMVQEGRGEVRRTAARALVAIHPRGVLTLAVLTEMAHDAEAESRAAALDALAGLRIGHTNALALYRNGLTDSNALVRAAGARALGEMYWKTRADVPLLAGVQTNDTDESVRVAAQKAIEKILDYATNNPAVR